MISPSRWQVVAGSVAGSSHLRDGRECEDAHEVCHLESGHICLAVADGAGSARFGGVGAATAVAGAIVSVRESLSAASPNSDDEWDSVVRAAFAAALAAIEDRARRQGSEAEESTTTDFACTLLIAIADATWTIGAQVGDGLIAVEAEGTLGLLTGPDRGEYLNETTFLTSAHYEDHLRMSVRNSAADGLVILTDGLEPVATNLATGALHTPFFTPLLRFAGAAASPDELIEFLSSPRVCERTDDDKTLVIAVRPRDAEEEHETR